MSEFNVGKTPENSSYNFNSLQSGLRRADLKTDKDKSIFDNIDKDKNGVLDEQEVTNYINKGTPAKEKLVTYTQNEDGTITEHITEPNNKTTVRIRKGDVIISEEINDNGKISKRIYYQNGYEEYSVDDNNNPIVDVYSSDGKKLAQQKTINGNTSSVLYDGNGNTKVIVQNGESLAVIAKKFGCSEEELKSLNKDVLKNGKYFNVGAEIKIPVELEADDARLEGRKSKEVSVLEYQEASAKRIATNIQLKEMGLKNKNGQGKKVIGTYKGGETEEFTIIGEASHDRILAKNKKGKVVTISHDGKILKEDYVKLTNLYTSGEKVQGKMRQVNEDGSITIVTKEFARIPDTNLPKGRIAVVDEKGKTYIMSHDGMILNKDYITRSTYADSIRHDKPAVQKITIDILSSQVDNAQAAFDAQMDKDGWAADVADGVSNIWGIFQENGNQAWRVREDLTEYKSELTKLRNATQTGDFEKEFKNMFGLAYNQDAVADYVENPSDANYQKAFGTKHNIGQRVAKYNHSQDTGATVVKGTATVAAGVVIGVTTGGTGLVALGTAAAATAASSVAINTSDRLSSNVGLKEGEMGEILQNAAWDAAGVLSVGFAGKIAGTVIKGASTAANLGRSAMKATGDVVLSAAQEYLQTGEISVTGTAINVGLGAVGMSAESGAFKRVKDVLTDNKKSYGNSSGHTGATNTNASLNTNDGFPVAGGLFTKSAKKPVALDSNNGWQNFDTADGGITLLLKPDGQGVYFGKVGQGSVPKQINLKPGEVKNLGKTTDGLDIVLTRDAGGNYLVRYDVVDKKSYNPSLLSRMFGGTTTLNETPPSVGNHSSTSNTLRTANNSRRTANQTSDSQLQRTVQDNMVDAQSRGYHFIGTPRVSNKFAAAINSKTPVVKILDQDIDLSDISKHVAPGEVCAVGTGTNKKLYVNNNGVAQELKISQEKFEELFPKTGFAMVQQEGRNNCWLISRINSMTESASGRAQIYSMFEETPDGDILVHLKNVDNPIRFPGGIPVSAPDINLGSGASPGIEMIHQAVLVRNLKDAELRQVTDISQLSASSLSDEVGRLEHSDFNATNYLFEGKERPKLIWSSNPNYRDNFIETLNDFKSGQNMITLTWEAHARHLVDYNPQTRMVTYHDPYLGGVDMVCSADDLMRKGAIMSVVNTSRLTIPKPPNVISRNTTSSTTSSTTSRIVSLDATSNTPFKSQTSTLGMVWNNVSQTADGAPIKARLSSDGNIVIEKDGKLIDCEAPTVDNPIPILERSTNTFIILVRNNDGSISVVTSETPDLSV